jgi:O-acetyl-ADP-ribose deacetylase (regulator of RNase III)
VTEIRYVKGDATKPVGDGPKVIAHICNDRGGWGSGFVVALSRRWPQPEREYRRWAEAGVLQADEAGVLNPFALGAVQFVLVDAQQDLWVANMVAQRGIRRRQGDPRAVDYGALATCLDRLGAAAQFCGYSVHMPRIGCGLGGGDWNEVSPLIEKALILKGVPVTVYDLS